MAESILSSEPVSQRVFYPQATDVPATRLVDVGEVQLACYLRSPYPHDALLLHFHGNGELAADYWEHFSSLFLESGLNVCFVDYRGYGPSGGLPDLLAQLEDNARLVEALGVPPRKLVVLGRSLGSLFAIDLASRFPDLAGLVLDSAIADLLETWPLEAEIAQLGRSRAELLNEVDRHFNNRRKLADYQGELLVMHAARDHLLDPSHAERLYDWCGSAHKRLVVFPRGDHNSIMWVNAPDYARELREMVARLGLAV